MLAIAFLNPMLLWALPLAAVPIIIHLLNRRRFQRVPWAAMTFLLAAMKRNRKRLRMEQWLVLLLRTLAVLLLVSLVSRPQLGGGSLLGTRTHHVIVLDDSASMTQRAGSTTLFDRAQDRVRALADDLTMRRSGDLFSIVRTSHATQPDMWGEHVGPELGRRVGT
ncbi:MAG: BatA domain-containing protein, partial [Planctomycetes bacterium]|nr:BatA domain-containing protein [Planctomycetota bacterium]